MPACHAGEPGDVCETIAGLYGTPILYATVAKMNAKMMFMITPAEMIAIRCGTLLAR